MTFAAQPAPGTAVLFLIFNRPALTQRVFERIRQARPPRLYVAADGPRANRPDDVRRCARARAIAAAVDWDCELRTLQRERNLGCSRAVAEAIDWFFDHEAGGIILEDDCLVSPEFFGFAARMLERYRDDPRVGMISACNFLRDGPGAPGDVEFTSYSHIWGWASWRRFWAHYQRDLRDWVAGGRRSAIGTRRAPVEAHWRRVLERCEREEIDTWDYQVLETLSRTGQLSVLPPVHLVENIGFGVDATHTIGEMPPILSRGPGRLAADLPPGDDSGLAAMDRFTEDEVYRIP